MPSSGGHVCVPRKVGPFDVEADGEQLVLRLENRGEISLRGCLLFGTCMSSTLILGILSVVQTAEKGVHTTMDNPSRLFAPTQNHFGFLWLLASLVTFIAVPLYVLRTYKAALTFTFRRSDDAFLRDNKIIARLRRIEYLSIRETRDPDTRYLYVLEIVYNDGQRMMLHNCYEEREIMNLANEIAVFVKARVLWK